MTETTLTQAKVTSKATPEERRARIIGIVLIVLAAFVFWVFGLNVMGDLNATFRLTLPTDAIPNIEWVVNTSTLAYIVAGVLAFLGGMLLWRSNARWTNIALAIGLVLFAFAFLAWAAAGKSFSLVPLKFFAAVPINSYRMFE